MRLFRRRYRWCYRGLWQRLDIDILRVLQLGRGKPRNSNSQSFVFMQRERRNRLGSDLLCRLGQEPKQIRRAHMVTRHNKANDPNMWQSTRLMLNTEYCLGNCLYDAEG